MSTETTTTETRASFSVSEDTKLKLPLRVQFVLLAFVAAGAAAWALTRRDVSDHADRLASVETKQASDHDVLVEIRADVKRLLREDERRRP